ncbi:class II fructose-bisphosphate aldolase [Clostridia bacterium OttesenSCG-928-O13]|nr:class II fructose-bisphosphate aldolase [Clostridia bacterium OttesenSCG-928-O13]
MLATLKQLAQVAEARGIALGAFNTPNLESIRAVLQAAEELGQPVILQHAQPHEAFFPIEIAAPVMLHLADAAGVPVCVHLDHGMDLALIQKALKAGFTSVMYDGSALPYEENKANTALVVEMAARTGASVEGEIGTVGAAQEGREEDFYTDPADAKDFVDSTGIDALACAFGTVHGLYKKEPRLDFDRVEKLYQTLDVPLVMHGGSGVSEEDYYKCIRRGIRKINYFTYASRAGGVAVKEHLAKAEVPYLHEIAQWGREGVRQDALAAIRMFSMLNEKPRAKVNTEGLA